MTSKTNEIRVISDLELKDVSGGMFMAFLLAAGITAGIGTGLWYAMFPPKKGS